VELLVETDDLYRATADQIDTFLNGLNPKVDLHTQDQGLFTPPFKDPTYKGDLWTTPVSPYHVLRRLFTFYCDCATVVTEIPIWAVTLKFEDTPSIVTGFLGSFVIETKPDLSKGTVHYQLFGFPDEFEPAEIVLGLALTAFPSASEPPVNTVADSTLLLSRKDPTHILDDFLVTKIKGEWAGSCEVLLDSVPFKSVVSFSVERFRHPSTNAEVVFPVRSFAALAPTQFVNVKSS
jgi:hypothetical protein